MLPGDISELHYFLQQETQSPNFGGYDLMPSHNNVQSSFNFNNLYNNNSPYPLVSVLHDQFTQQQSSSTVSNNSTSDEADDLQQSIIDERKQRRMISNRESARRSRMRKQKHLDELWSQVLRLRTENRNLIDKLNHVSDCLDKVLQDNAKLKREASDLHEMLAELKIGGQSNYTTDLRVLEVEEVHCNTAHLRAESSSSQSNITSSVNLLH